MERRVASTGVRFSLAHQSFDIFNHDNRIVDRRPMASTHGEHRQHIDR